ncbi:MAG: integrase arm-type DNA-binding domain-containing protein [Deltaproteobacteria bacterium]|nr:integrase arm-type DNA-binding domain-containing protein [Deltaproteobacteria bacterium]
MKITTFTDTFIKKLKPSDKKYVRGEGNGFTVRVMPSGVKTWLYVYSFDDKRHEMNLGSYPDVTLETARGRFDDARKKVKNGIDPIAEKEQAEIERKKTPIISDFVTEYIENYAKIHNKGWKEIERALKANIVSKWGKRKITDIKKRDLVLLLDEIVNHAPIMANRTLAYTRKLFSFAVNRGVLEIHPFLRMDAPAPAKVRKRNLTFAEIKALWTNLDASKMSSNIKRVLKLILVTGQRPGEVIGMHTSEIDGRWWTIPEERSKNKQAHRVYLTDLAIELIGDKEGYVFESPVNVGKSLEVRTLTHAIKENLPHTAESKVVDYLKIPHFVPHDLRRTFTSRMAEMGTFEDTIDRVQNHIAIVKAGVRKNYNHYPYDNEKQQALESWEQKLNSIIS